jgi:DNA-binding GntR family transcriptional regulator
MVNLPELVESRAMVAQSPLRSGRDHQVLAGLTLDRTSPVPLYFQVAQHLERAIEEGSMPPGTRLDNEIEMAGRLGLSRPTLRRAMQYLVDKGLLVRRRGVGTRVVQPKVRRPLELTSLYDDLAASGQRPATAVLNNEVVPAPADVATALGLPAESPVIWLVRLRSAGEQPIARMVNYLLPELPGLTTDALVERGLYQLIRASGVTLHAATQTIGARTATVAEARLLGESRGAAVLTMQRLTYDDHGRAIEYGTHIYAASRYSFELSLLTG